MPLLLLVIGIASIIPAAWDAYRAHTIGWTGGYENTQAFLDGQVHGGLTVHKYPIKFSFSVDRTSGEMHFANQTDYYEVVIDRREFFGLWYQGQGEMLIPKLETMHIVSVKHTTNGSMSGEPRVDLLLEPYPDALLSHFEYGITNYKSLLWNLMKLHPSKPVFKHEGVMEPRAILDEDGKPTRNDEGELELTPVHAFSYYRVTHGTLETPMSWDRFWVQAWGVLRWTLVGPMVLYVVGYLGCYCLYFKRRTRRRVEQGLCIKCAYPMQPNRDGVGMICTECGYLDHVDTLNT